MIDLTVIGSRYWVEVPVIVLGLGNLKYLDGNGNEYQEVDIDDVKDGKWVFELVDSMLVARYVKIIHTTLEKNVIGGNIR